MRTTTEDEVLAVEPRAWEGWKETIGQRAHEAWLTVAPAGHPDAKPWGELTAEQRDVIVNCIAARARFRATFRIGFLAGRLPTAELIDMLVDD